jgi:methylthioribose-1-phosphate isomerase
MSMTERSHEEVNATRRLLSQAVPLVGESHALSYALVMSLASTPRERFSDKEIDALCQVTYELQEKLTTALELFREMEKVSKAASEAHLH